MVRERAVGEVLDLRSIVPIGRAKVEQVAPTRAPEAIHGHDVRERHDRYRRHGKERRSRPHAEERQRHAAERGRREQRQRGPRGSEQSRLVGSLPGPERRDGCEPDEKRDVGASRHRILLDHERGGHQRRRDTEPAGDPEDASVERIAERAVGHQRSRNRPGKRGDGSDLERHARCSSGGTADSVREAEDDEQASPLTHPVSACERIQPRRVPACQPEVVVPCPQQ